MTLRNGVFLDRASLDPGDLDLSELESTLPSWRFYDTTGPHQVRERIGDADVVISNKVLLDAEIVSSAKDLKLVCVAATGVNNVDLEACRARGVAVSNCRAYGSASVVQHVFSLILTLARRLDDQRRSVSDGTWARSPVFCVLDFPMADLEDMTLAVIGAGVLGRAVAAMGEAFGMTVILSERRGRPPRPGRLPFEDALTRADVLSLHCPLSNETRGLIGPGEISRMKPGALLVNTARGGLVDEAALVEALRSGHLGGAAFDVLEREPPSGANALLEADLPNLIVTPHIAWASGAARRRLTDQLVQIVRGFEAGEAVNRVV